MECNNTFILIKQKEEQNLSAEDVCQIMNELFMELTQNTSTLQVNDMSVFRNSMDYLLENILPLYENNVEEFKNYPFFQMMNNQKEKIVFYQQQINNLKEDIDALAKTNQQLSLLTQDYHQYTQKKNELIQEQITLSNQQKEMEDIDLKTLEQQTQELKDQIQTIQQYHQLKEEVQTLQIQKQEYDDFILELQQLKEEKQTLETQLSKINLTKEKIEQAEKHYQYLLSKINGAGNRRKRIDRASQDIHQCSLEEFMNRFQSEIQKSQNLLDENLLEDIHIARELIGIINQILDERRTLF